MWLEPPLWRVDSRFLLLLSWLPEDLGEEQKWPAWGRSLGVWVHLELSRCPTSDFGADHETREAVGYPLPRAVGVGDRSGGRNIPATPHPLRSHLAQPSHLVKSPRRLYSHFLSPPTPTLSENRTGTVKLLGSKLQVTEGAPFSLLPSPLCLASSSPHPGRPSAPYATVRELPECWEDKEGLHHRVGTSGKEEGQRGRAEGMKSPRCLRLPPPGPRLSRSGKPPSPASSPFRLPPSAGP